jgi:hypothetical protein
VKFDMTNLRHTVGATAPAAPGDVRLASAWLLLGIGALALAGIFAILLVLARTPGIQSVFPWVDFFRTALVVHVDQSVLIWFLAFAGSLWTLKISCRGRPLQVLGLGLAVLGTLVIALAPFLGAGNPLMNNYVPVLQHPLFHIGLGLFGLGVVAPVVAAGFALPALRDAWMDGDAVRVALISAAWAALFALVALVWSYLQIPDTLEGQGYYEYLFWGGGHLLQFTYTQLMLGAWLWLAGNLGLRLPGGRRLPVLLLLLGVLPVLATPLIHLFHGTVSAESRIAYTRLMQWGGGIAALPIGALLLVALARRPQIAPSLRPQYRALLASLLLFAVGGLIGWLISGVNTVIPAHYHGSIVGVTLALMGLSYHLLPHMGFGEPPQKLASIQPLVYAVGQILHVGGLAFSGAMGIQRKTAGAAQGLDRLPEILAMGVMGLGGLLAVIGGILFVVAALLAIFNRRRG